MEGVNMRDATACADVNQHHGESTACRQLNRGQLRIQLETDGERLRVHVLEARHLQPNGQRSKGHIFAKVSIPGTGENDTSCQQTELIPFTSSPCFNTVFNFDLSAEDERRRLMLSVWSSSDQHGSLDFIGGMSFGLRHLVSKCLHQGAAVSGWYFLLSQQLGNRKHLLAQCEEKMAKGKDAQTYAATESGSSLHTGDQYSEGSTGSTTYNITLPKLPTGYGFTVQGSCPAKVGHVKVKGSANACGIRPGDQVLKVNGEDVSRSLASHVASLVRNSQQLNLQLGRSTSTVSMATTSQKSAHLTALTPVASAKTHNNTYETLPQVQSPKVGCLLLNHRKHKNHDKVKGRKAKRSLNCMYGASKNLAPVYKTLQNENLPPTNSMSVPVVEPSPSPFASVRKRTDSHIRAERDNVPGNSSPLVAARSSLLYESKAYTPKAATPLKERYVSGTKMTPTNYLESQMRVHPSGSEKGLEIHRWLDSVAQETCSFLRKDGSYSHSSTSPEVSVENTVLQASSSSFFMSPTSRTFPTPEKLSRRKMISDDNLKWDPGISIIEGSKGSLEGLNHLLVDCDNQVDNGDLTQEAFDHDDSAFAESDFDNAYLSGPLDEKYLIPDNSPITYKNYPSVRDSLDTVVTTTPMSESSTCIHNASHLALIHSAPELPSEATSCFGDTEDSDDQVSFRSMSHHDQCLEELVHCESAFVRCMQWGVERYSRPLRHALLPPAKHKAVFQNIEKLVTLSQYHLQQLLATGDLDLEDDAATMTLAIYRPRSKILCEAYDHYLSGFADAVTLLHNLRESDRRFADFVTLRNEDGDDEESMSVDQFIQMPLKHLQDLVRCFKSCSQDISMGLTLSLEADSVKSIITDLEFIWQKWTPADQRDGPLVHPRSAEVRGQMPHEAWPADRGVDSQILLLQRRLLPGSKGKDLQLATQNRHMVFSSELLLLDGATSQPVIGWLLSDMILLTRSEVKDRLTLVEEPIMLQDIVSCELGCDHSCELLLYSQKSSQSLRHNHPHMSSLPLSCHRLRVVSAEQRQAWYSILDHRLRLCSQS